MLGKCFGKSRTGLNIRRTLFKNVAQLAGLELGNQYVDTAQQRQTRVDERGKLTGHRHDFLGLHATEVKLVDALFLFARTFLVALGGLTHRRRIETQGPYIINGQCLTIGRHDTRDGLAFFVGGLIEILGHDLVPSSVFVKVRVVKHFFGGRNALHGL